MLLKPRSPAPLPRASTNGPTERPEWGLAGRQQPTDPDPFFFSVKPCLCGSEPGQNTRAPTYGAPAAPLSRQAKQNSEDHRLPNPKRIDMAARPGKLKVKNESKPFWSVMPLLFRRPIRGVNIWLHLQRRHSAYLQLRRRSRPGNRREAAELCARRSATGGKEVRESTE